MAYLKMLAALVLAAGLFACASGQRSGASVEVFGTIDASVTHSTTRTGR